MSSFQREVYTGSMELGPEYGSLLERCPHSEDVSLSIWKQLYHTLALMILYMYIHMHIFSDSADAISNDLIAAGLLEMKDMVVGEASAICPIPMISFCNVFILPFQLLQTLQNWLKIHRRLN